MKEIYPDYITYVIPEEIAEINAVAGLKIITPSKSIGTGWTHTFRSIAITEVVITGATFSFTPAKTDERFHYVLINLGEEDISVSRLEQVLVLPSESWLVLPPGGHTEMDLPGYSRLVILAIEASLFRYREIEIIAGIVVDSKESKSNRFFLNALENVVAAHKEIIVDQGSMAVTLMASLRLSKPYRDAIYASETPPELYYAAQDIIGELLYLRDLDSVMLGNLFGVTDKVLNEVFASANTTVAKEILLARLLRAKDYLTDPNNNRGSIAFVAHDVGIDNLSYFSREYKKHFGYPPSEDFNFKKHSIRIRSPMLNIRMFTELLLTNQRIRELALKELHSIPYTFFVIN